ncbi:MAG: hypothetical protein MUF75_07855 [Bacteroidia bacterium]|jgi:hypothetical protein|nr:hypothetical protein [Bacteroidia bacterium]
MKNKHLVLSCIALLAFSQVLIAQNVEVVRRADRFPEYEAETFSFIAPGADTNRLQYVATLRATGVGKNVNLEMIYIKLKEKANSLGANAFQLLSFKRWDSIYKSILVMNMYFASDSVLNLHRKHQEKNVVYIFGDTEKSDKVQSFKVDNLKKEIKGGTYYRHQNAQGQEVKINKGGFTGATVWIKWKENKAATFLTLTGFGLNNSPVPAGQMGASFHTGRMNYLDENLGQLLVHLLKPGN